MLETGMSFTIAMIRKHCVITYWYKYRLCLLQYLASYIQWNEISACREFIKVAIKGKMHKWWQSFPLIKINFYNHVSSYFKFIWWLKFYALTFPFYTMYIVSLVLTLLIVFCIFSLLLWLFEFPILFPSSRKLFHQNVFKLIKPFVYIMIILVVVINKILKTSKGN